MAVGADQRVGVDHLGTVAVGACLHPLGQILEIDLMDDPRGGRHHVEVLEGSLAPAQELVAFAVALELDGGVGGERQRAVVFVDLNRVVDDQVDRYLWIDGLWIATEPVHGAPQRRQIDHRRNPREVLQDDPGGFEGNLDLLRAGRIIGRQAADVVGRNREAILGAKQRLEQHLDGERQPVDAARPSS